MTAAAFFALLIGYSPVPSINSWSYIWVRPPRCMGAWLRVLVPPSWNGPGHGLSEVGP